MATLDGFRKRQIETSIVSDDCIMEKKSSLFRKEAIKNRLNRSLGTTRINTPMNYQIAGLSSLALISIIVIFLCCAHTTSKISVKGFLDTERGILSIHSELGGFIVKEPIQEGTHVNKGDTLCIIISIEQEKNLVVIDNITQQINNLKQELHLKKEHYQALKQLFKKNYISASLLNETKTELLEIQNKIQSADLEIIKYKHSLYQLIRAPIEGTITNIFYSQGQTVDAAKTLLHIIPAYSKLIARLYVPSRDIGFVKKTGQVVINYDAYPAQKFGFYKAMIKEINLTVLTDEKEDKPISVGAPYYKISAELEKNYIYIYGKKSLLSHGLTFTAVISGHERKIWQWLFDPVYSYYGELLS